MRHTARASVVLTALGIGVFQLVGSLGAADNQPERRGLDAVAVVLLLVGPAALALRDRWPVGAVIASIGAAAVYLGRGHPYGPIFVSVVVALFSAVQAGRRRSTWLLAAAGYLAFVIAEVVDPRAQEIGWLHWSLVAGWLVVVLAVSEVVRIRREQAAERAHAAHEERQRLLSEQRLGLAQELHDVLAHNISLINVQASVALHLLDDRPEGTRPALVAIKDASHEALEELRTALDTLRYGEHAPRAPLPRLADLDGLVDGVRASGLAVHVKREAVPELPAAVELAAFRIAQEALTNVTRHAHARSVSIRVAYDDGLILEVTDDGVGGEALEGNGLIGMRERAAALGGSVEVGPRREGGFRVAAYLPAPS